MTGVSKSATKAHSEQPAAKLRRSPRKTTAPSSSNESAAASHVEAVANAATASCSSEQVSDVLEDLQCAFDGLQVVSIALRNGVSCMVAGAARGAWWCALAHLCAAERRLTVTGPSAQKWLKRTVALSSEMVPELAWHLWAWGRRPMNVGTPNSQSTILLYP